MAIYLMGVVFAPILGPVLGGWITDNWGWRWIFYINLPIGFISLVLTLFFIFDPSYIKRKISKIDYRGLGFLAIGLGCLQIVLDKGQLKDWFNSDFIVALSLISFVSLFLFAINEMREKEPAVNLRVLKDRSYSTGNLVIFFAWLIEHLTPVDVFFQQSYESLKHTLPSDFHALGAIHHELLRQSKMMAFNDAFFFCFVVFLFLLPSLAIFKKAKSN